MPDMTFCPPDVIDLRPLRLDAASTVGQPLSLVLTFRNPNGTPFDLTGTTVTAGLLDSNRVPVPDDPFTQTVNLAAGIVTLSLTGPQTAEEPFGAGVWTWWLGVQLPGAAAPSYPVTGSLSLSALGVNSTGSRVPSESFVIEGDITITMSVVQGAPGAPGGQMHVGVFPPANLAYGMSWQMTPDDHCAVYSSRGWLPLWPTTDNLAVEAGNALLGIDGLWLSSDGD